MMTENGFERGNEKLRDEELWQIAKARAAFRWCVVSYVVLNAFLVAIWFFSSGPGSYFWPIWPIMGWGVAVAMQYFHAFHGHQYISARQEFDRLKREQQERNI